MPAPIIEFSICYDLNDRIVRISAEVRELIIDDIDFQQAMDRLCFDANRFHGQLATRRRAQSSGWVTLAFMMVRMELTGAVDSPSIGRWSSSAMATRQALGGRRTTAIRLSANWMAPSAQPSAAFCASKDPWRVSQSRRHHRPATSSTLPRNEWADANTHRLSIDGVGNRSPLVSISCAMVVSMLVDNEISKDLVPPRCAKFGIGQSADRAISQRLRWRMWCRTRSGRGESLAMPIFWAMVSAERKPMPRMSRASR